MNEEIQSEILDFEQEPEAKRFLSKKYVAEQHPEGLVFEVIAIGKVEKVSKKGAKYKMFKFVLADDFQTWDLECFREEIRWGKVKTPKKILINAEETDKDKEGNTLYKWKIESFNG